MSNPFEGRRADVGPKHLAVGDTRTITGGSQRDPITLIRTARPYVEDYRDALNAHRTRSDIEWFITPEGELKCGWSREATARHNRINADRDRTERARNLRNHLNGYQKDEPDAQD